MPVFGLVVYKANEHHYRHESSVKLVEEVIRPPPHYVSKHSEDTNSKNKRELVLQFEERRCLGIFSNGGQPFLKFLFDLQLLLL